MTVIEQWAARLLDAPAADQAAHLDEKLRAHLTDTLCAMIAGAHSSEGRALAGSHAMFGEGLNARMALAIAQTRLTEIDDIHMGSCITAGAVLTPVALMLGHELGAKPEVIARALRAGYDAMTGFGLACDSARLLYKGIWPTYLTAPLGAAVCAGVVQGLDARGLAQALSLALAQISGAAGGAATGTKPVRNARWALAGWAAIAGVNAAHAAREGFGGDLTLLDGDWLARTHGIAFEREILLARQSGDGIAESSLKPWCTAKQASSALAGFLDLLSRGIAVNDITAVRVHVPAAYRAMISHMPPGRIGRIVSIAWQCALAGLYRDELYDIERADHAHEEPFAALMSKVSVHEDSTLAAHFPQRYPARVEIECADGAQHTCTIVDAPGDPQTPLSKAQQRDKLVNVLQLQHGRARAEDYFSFANDVFEGQESLTWLFAAMNAP